MNRFEELEQEAHDNRVNVYNYYLGEDDLKGVYIDGNIAINNSVNTTTEKACVLVEELGHYHTTVGNILDLSDAQNSKQERQARLWAYNKRIGLHGLIRAYESNCKDWHEVAEYLDVTEEFLREGVECYTRKYGMGVSVDNYYITFIPRLQIFKLI